MYAHERYIHIRFYGEVGDEILINYLDKAFLIPAFRSKDQLVDYLEVTKFLFTTPGLFRFCSTLNNRCETWPRQKDRKVAVLAPENIVQLAGLTGGVFVQELLSLEHAPQHRFFQSKGDALEW